MCYPAAVDVQIAISTPRAQKSTFNNPMLNESSIIGVSRMVLLFCNAVNASSLNVYSLLLLNLILRFLKHLHSFNSSRTASRGLNRRAPLGLNLFLNRINVV